SGCEWLGLAPVANREDRHLFALEQFLDHERVTATPCRLQAGVELCLRSADEHALSGREPVDLDDTRRPRDREPFRRRHAGRSHDVLGEALRALDASRGSAWAEDGDARMPELVGEPGYEGRFRPDDDKVDFVVEPGLDRHEWETEWQGLQPLIVDSPAEALPEVDRLIERMLTERGYPTTEEEARDSASPELVAEFLEARRITNMIERGETDDPGEIGAAITAYRNLYEFLLGGPSPP